MIDPIPVAVRRPLSAAPQDVDIQTEVGFAVVDPNDPRSQETIAATIHPSLSAAVDTNIRVIPVGFQFVITECYVTEKVNNGSDSSFTVSIRLDGVTQLSASVSKGASQVGIKQNVVPVGSTLTLDSGTAVLRFSTQTTGGGTDTWDMVVKGYLAGAVAPGTGVAPQTSQILDSQDPS